MAARRFGSMQAGGISLGAWALWATSNVGVSCIGACFVDLVKLMCGVSRILFRLRVNKGRTTASSL